MKNQKQQKKEKPKSNKNWTVLEPHKAKEVIDKIVKQKDKKALKEFKTVLPASEKKKMLDQVPEGPAKKNKRIIQNRKITVQVGDKKIQLTAAQKEFCEIYASAGEFFANGVQSYIEAYDIDTSEPGAYTGAKSSAYRLLTNADILDYINSLLELGHLNDSFADKQLEFLMTQNADLAVKRAAVWDYNKLKQRIIDRSKHEEDINIKIEEDPEGDYAKFLKEQIKKKAQKK